MYTPGENTTRSAGLGRKRGTLSRRVVVLIDVNARTGRQGGGLGSEHCRVLGAYGRNTRYDNGDPLLTFTFSDDLALVNTYASTSKDGISHSF